MGNRRGGFNALCRSFASSEVFAVLHFEGFAVLGTVASGCVVFVSFALSSPNQHEAGRHARSLSLSLSLAISLSL